MRRFPGGDSVALLRGLAALKLPGEGRLIAAHANHKLRGVDSDADQAFVQQLCQQLGLVCEIATATVDPSSALAARESMPLLVGLGTPCWRR